MNPTAHDSTASMILMPHQAALVERFFNPSSKRIVILRADVGLGKTTALVAVANRLLREQPSGRVLCVVPGSALRMHFVYKLREAGTPALDVDRYRFRELLDSTSGDDVWPAGSVTVMTREFARQDDIRNFLAGARWDLLIVDEAHQFKTELGRDIVRHLGDSSDRIILSALPNLELPDAFPEQNATVVTWRRDRIVDFDGTPLYLTTKPTLFEVRYDLSSTELGLGQTVDELFRLFRNGTTQQALIASSWLRSVQSSPAALEAKLAQVWCTIGLPTPAGVLPLPDTFDDEEFLENQLVGWLDPVTAEKATPIAARLFKIIEGLDTDSKLVAFTALLNRFGSATAPSKQICVLTEYFATLFYLAAEIETQGVPCIPVHGRMGNEDRQRAVELFSSAGGILMATRAALSEGIALPEVTDLVLYDVPSSDLGLRQILGRFDRFGRRTPLKVYALLPSTDTFGNANESIQVLRQALDPATSKLD